MPVDVGDGIDVGVLVGAVGDDVGVRVTIGGSGVPDAGGDGVLVEVAIGGSGVPVGIGVAEEASVGEGVTLDGGSVLEASGVKDSARSEGV